MVYQIIAQKFMNQHMLKLGDGKGLLRMLMTGPGGIGKTHIVRALQELMKLHKSQHLIHFLGPNSQRSQAVNYVEVKWLRQVKGQRE